MRDIEEKGENACKHLPEYFQNSTLHGSLVVAFIQHSLTHSHTMTPFDATGKLAF